MKDLSFFGRKFFINMIMRWFLTIVGMLLTCVFLARSENISRSRCGNILTFGRSDCHDQESGKPRESVESTKRSSVEQKTTNDSMVHGNGTETSDTKCWIHCLSITSIVLITLTVLAIVVFLILAANKCCHQISRNKKGKYTTPQETNDLQMVTIKNNKDKEFSS